MQFNVASSVKHLMSRKNTMFINKAFAQLPVLWFCLLITRITPTHLELIVLKFKRIIPSSKK